MKKLLLLLVSFVLLLSVVGCGTNTSKDAEPTEPATEATQEPVEEPAKTMSDITVGFAQSGNPNSWMVALTETMEAEAKEHGVNYVYTDANDDIATHVSNIEDMLAQGLDYLVVAPIDNNGLESVFEEAANMGVPVITVGRTTNGEYETTVYSDQAWEGERCAEIVGEWKADAKVVEIRGIEGTSSVDGRAAGFRKIMEEQYPDMQITVEQTANFSVTEALDAMSNVIESEGAENIDVVFCHNDGMAFGVIQAIKDAGYVPGEDIMVVSIDGEKAALDAIIAGELMASVQCSPVAIGPTTFDAIQTLLDGGTLEAETIVPDQIFDITNAADSYHLAF